MKFKLSAVVKKFIGAEKELTDIELSSLTDGDYSSTVVTVSSGESLVLSCDLFNRHDLHRLEYYHSSGGSVDVYVSETEGVWEQSVTVSEDWGTLVYFSNLYKPRWIKIYHRVSSGSVYPKEIDFYNSDGHLLFGPHGSYASYGYDSSGNTVQKVSVYNNTSSVKDVCVFIDDNGVYSEGVLQLGLSSSGSFYPKRFLGLSIPSDFSWDSGKHDGTETNINGHLTVSGASVSGTYYSPVISVSSYENYRFFWEGVYDGPFSINYLESIDNVNGFGLRKYNHPPSGGWVSGELADESDYYWSTVSGVLEFGPVLNDTIVTLDTKDYVQFITTITGSATIYTAGFEAPLIVENVPSNSFSDFYLSSISGTVYGDSVNLIAWHKE